MPEPNLTPDERAAITRLLRDTIAADRFPLSPRIRKLKSALAKLEPTPVAEPQPYPAVKAWTNSSVGTRRSRRR